MYTLLIVLHLLVSFIMIGVILLQSGKGAEIGAAFGGSSQTIFGSRGPGTFLSKVTVGTAVIFMFTSLGLAILSKERSLLSVIDLKRQTEQPAATSPPPASDQPAPAATAPQSTPPDAAPENKTAEPKE
jgi:preprotein translocase subunit SecG